MKRIFALAAMLSCAWLARAQIEVRLSLEREAFLPGEDMEVALKVSNFSGGPLKLGDRADWLRFTVERTDGGVVNKVSEVEESGAFTLAHATTGTLRFNLMPHFALDRSGSYRVVAEVNSSATGETFTSKPARFDIVTGVRLNHDREIGVTLPDGTVERRKFVLQQVNFMQKLRLYVRVCDATESKTFKVTTLGPVVSFDPPKWVLDRQNRFHVLHRVDSNHYAYHVFQSDGSLVQRELHRFAQSTPELRVNEAGEITVVGGVRRPVPSDIPSAAAGDKVPAATSAAPAKTPEANDAKKEQSP